MASIPFYHLDQAADGRCHTVVVMFFGSFYGTYGFTPHNNPHLETLFLSFCCLTVLDSSRSISMGKIHHYCQCMNNKKK
jgi:hypothetical protein